MHCLLLILVKYYWKYISCFTKQFINILGTFAALQFAFILFYLLFVLWGNIFKKLTNKSRFSYKFSLTNISIAFPFHFYLQKHVQSLSIDLQLCPVRFCIIVYFTLSNIYIYIYLPYNTHEVLVIFCFC